MDRLIITMCLLFMLAGVAVRFTFLDGKVFGNDEATTSLHVSGKTIAQYASAMFDGQQRTARELLVFQRPDPEHGNQDVIQSLASEDPQHPPLYYLIERQWESNVGSSIWNRRVLSAVFGAVAVVMAVWLGSEAFSLVAGCVSGALVAVSPFAIAYSQVAREYSLWLALTFAACAIFVRAVKRGGLLLWSFYTIVSIAGLYTDALFALVIAAQAIAVIVPGPRRFKPAFEFLASTFVAVVAYVPWILALINGYTHGSVTNNTYLSAGLSLKPFILKWTFNIGSLFYDGDYLYPRTAVLILPALFALVIAFVACARRLRGNPQLGVLFALACVSLGALVVPDLLHNQQRSTASRYLIPLWVSCYTAFGVGLAIGFQSVRRSVRVASIGLIVFSAAVGLVSFSISASRDTWWVDGSTASIRPMARALARVNDPTIIYESTWGPRSRAPEVWDFTVVLMANVVAPDTPIIQYASDSTIALPSVPGSLLLLDPSDTLIAAFQRHGILAKKLVGGNTSSANADIAALRQTVARERERQGPLARLPQSPSLWAVYATSR